MAASTTVFATGHLLGLSLSSKSSTPAVAPLTRTNGNDGYVYIYGKASEAIGSITTCKIRTAGSISDDSGSAGWTANVSGGAVTGQYFWLRRTTIA
jgi:hypothetical protein